ncbi:hypothetical protein SNE40_004561 [Patella caerulea]
MKYPGQYLTPEELYITTGVRLSQVPLEHLTNEDRLAELRKFKGYVYNDYVTIVRGKTEEEKIKMKAYMTEHIHHDPEVRLIVDGSGYFEVRDIDDNWVRMHVFPGDLIDLPTGIFHRFSLDNDEYVRMHRLFTDVPDWTAVNRTDIITHPSRDRYLDYMNQVKTGLIEAN